MNPEDIGRKEKGRDLTAPALSLSISSSFYILAGSRSLLDGLRAGGRLIRSYGERAASEV